MVREIHPSDSESLGYLEFLGTAPQASLLYAFLFFIGSHNEAQSACQLRKEGNLEM